MSGKNVGTRSKPPQTENRGGSAAVDLRRRNLTANVLTAMLHGLRSPRTLHKFEISLNSRPILIPRRLPNQSTDQGDHRQGMRPMANTSKSNILIIRHSSIHNSYRTCI